MRRIAKILREGRIKDGNSHELCNLGSERERGRDDLIEEVGFLLLLTPEAEVLLASEITNFLSASQFNALSLFRGRRTRNLLSDFKNAWRGEGEAALNGRLMDVAVFHPTLTLHGVLKHLYQIEHLSLWLIVLVCRLIYWG